MTDSTEVARARPNEIATGVWYVPALIANLFFVRSKSGPWVMIDAGVPGTAAWIRGVATQICGDRKPEAILLTHGHFDHVGALQELADEWDVPVYAHSLELPYLDGRDNYPPPDPTVGGFMAQLSRLFPCKGIDVGHRLRTLKPEEGIPSLPGWRIVPTPGHTPGHVSFFREEDRTLLAGDAVITIDQQNPIKLVAQTREIYPPPRYFTIDWEQSRASVHALAELRPVTLAAGHGLPVSGAGVADMLSTFAQKFQTPSHGRYVGHPVLADEQGVYFIPPKPRDPVPVYAAGVAIAAAGLLFTTLREKDAPGPSRARMPRQMLRPGD